jgi:RNA polymerase sigma factor (sigma-70 family)
MLWPMDDALDQWFAREILAHEPALMRYLARVWPNRTEVADLRQEIYAKVLEAAMRAVPTSPKAFLFTAARNLMTDRLRRSRIIFIGARGDLDAMNVLVDDLSPESRFTALQELTRLAQAFDALPPKCRTVTWLRKVEQLPQREVARRLGVQEKAVEKQVARGMRLLTQAMLGAQDASLQSDAEIAQSELDHG